MQRNSLLSTAVIILGAITLLSSCKKQQLPDPSYEEAVYFYIPFSSIIQPFDSITLDQQINYAFSGNYSFYWKHDNTIVQDTCWLSVVRVMGNTSSAERSIKLAAVDAETTATEGAEYKLLDYTVPVDSFTAKLGVVVYRSAAMINNPDSVFKLTLQLQPNTSFPGTVKYNTVTADQNFYEGNTFRLYITGKPQQPLYWPRDLLGAWSRVKEEFIFSTLGLYFGLTAGNIEEYNKIRTEYRLQLMEALQTYNNLHPEPDNLKDENGNLVSFY